MNVSSQISFLLDKHSIKSLNTLFLSLHEVLQDYLASALIEGLSIDDIKQTYLPLAALLASSVKKKKEALIIGINGAQGSGKSTLCQILRLILEQGFSLRVAVLSIDDLYLTRAARMKLARTIHPLFATRGVPGTHDVALGEELFDALVHAPDGTQVELPVFDKSLDDRAPRSQWQKVAAPVDLILFEGWCVGARPQTESELEKPVNRLEQREDEKSIWRRAVNDSLNTSYRHFFDRIDRLIMLKVPDMDCVYRWRLLQEEKLAATTGSRPNSKIMPPDALRRFIMHYERLTRFMLEEMPPRANLVIELNPAHQIDHVHLDRWPANFISDA